MGDKYIMGKFSALNFLQRKKEEEAKLWEEKARELRKKVDDMLAEENAKLIAMFMSTHNMIMCQNAIVPMSEEEKKLRDSIKKNESIVRS